MEMERAKTIVHNVKTPSGQISYAEAGSGPVALFRPRRVAEQPSLAPPDDRVVGYPAVHCG